VTADQQRAAALVALLPASVREHAAWIVGAEPLVRGDPVAAAADIRRTIAALRLRNARLERGTLLGHLADAPDDALARARLAEVNAGVARIERGGWCRPMTDAWLERERNPPPRRPRGAGVPAGGASRRGAPAPRALARGGAR
jgi:hypothetical protein